MEEIYRGDTFEFDFSANLADGSIYTFKVGDLIKVGIKEKISKSKCALYKEILIEEETNVIPIVFSHEEMKKCCKGDKLLEVELTDTEGRVKTLYQDKITILEDIINE